MAERSGFEDAFRSRIVVLLLENHDIEDGWRGTTASLAIRKSVAMESTVFCRGENEQVVVKGAINKGNVIYIYIYISFFGKTCGVYEMEIVRLDRLE